MDNSKIYCDKCGATNSKNTTFCTGCGERLIVSSSKIKCFACQTENPETNTFCSKCGLQLKQSSDVRLPKAKQGFSLSTGNVISLIGAILVLVSLFLPAIKVEVFGYKETFTLFPDYDMSWVALALGIVLIVCSIQRRWKLHLVTSAVVSVIAVRFIMKYDEVINEMGEYAGFVDKGIGLYLIIIGCIVALIGGFLMKNEE